MILLEVGKEGMWQVDDSFKLRLPRDAKTGRNLGYCFLYFRCVKDIIRVYRSVVLCDMN